MLKIGQCAEFSTTISQSDVLAFAELVGDRNPVHLDPEYAKHTRFGRPIAHGMLIASYISRVLATDLPGPGTIYLEQALRFLAPAFVGDTITVKVTLTEKHSGKPVFALKTVCQDGNGKVLVDGVATVLYPSAQGQSHE
jgi:3-hydroxybutyryl-CoA dehydratase